MSEARMRLDGYVRVSQVRGREGETFISPEVQKDTVSRWAALRGVEIAEWHTDLDVTGGTMKRPALDRVLERIRTGQTGGVAVARLDRFSRAGLSDALATVAQIHDAGGELAAVDLGIDPTTPFGEFAMTIMLALARMQRRQIADNWREAQRRAVERGVHIASKAPTGYVRRDDGRLEQHPDHAQAIGELFRLRANGASWGEMCAYLDRQGVVGPYEATHWTTRAVQRITENRVYLGEARSGENVKPGAHQPLTDPVTFERAQRTRQALTPRTGEPALLSGLLRCAGCRFLMKPDRMTLRDGTRVRIYRCRGNHSTGRCADRAAVLGTIIEPWVEARYFDRMEGTAAKGAVATVGLADLEAAVRDAEAEMVAFRDDERIKALGQDVYVEGLREKVARLDDARQELADARGDVPVDVPDFVELEALWPELPVVERQKLLGAVVDAVILRSGRSLAIGDRALVLWRGEMPDDFPRRGRRMPVRPFEWPPDGSGVASA